MKDIEISSLELDTRIRKVVLLSQKEIRRNHLSQKGRHDSILASQTELPVGLKFPSKKFKLLLGFLVLYHYYPLEESVYCYFHLDLLEHIEKTEAFWLSVLMDKDLFLKYLVEQRTITLQQFFAGIVNSTTLLSLLENIKLSFEEKLKVPRRLVRRKGYRDKGSLGSEDLRALKREVSNDFYLTMYQYELEEKQQIQSDLSLLLKEHLQEGRVLTDQQKFEFRLISRKEINNESEGSITAKDYCQRRSREEIVRKERKDRAAIERNRIQTLEAETHITEH